MLIASLPAGAVAASSDYARAREAYQAHDPVLARALYEGLVAAGVDHPDLFYNLGTACLAAGELGCAAHNLEQALRRDSRAEDIRGNLALVHAEVALRVPDRMTSAERRGRLDRVLGWVSMDGVATFFLIAEILAMAALAWLLVARARRRRRGIAVVAVVVLCSLALALGLALWAARRELDVVSHGIVLVERGRLHAAADPHSEVRAPVHAGLRVVILGQEGGWLRVRLANGGQGWVAREAVGILD